MFFGSIFVRNDAMLNELERATLALGEVLSTPMGVILMGTLQQDEFYANSNFDEYQSLVDAGKRPTKKRETILGMSRFYKGEANGLADALIFAVQQATNWTVRRRYARLVVNDELDAMQGYGTSNLYVKCMSLAYARN
ncbi:MAG: hypothetical protein IKE20_07670 [Eggerthellaceae bacterium]|nr:hypothetical protein [Eggerthellaceae bacterium]MBR3160046.1 hypothetical protein [Atopobiaceae bacterium]